MISVPFNLQFNSALFTFRCAAFSRQILSRLELPTAIRVWKLNASNYCYLRSCEVWSRTMKTERDSRPRDDRLLRRSLQETAPNVRYHWMPLHICCSQAFRGTSTRDWNTPTELNRGTSISWPSIQFDSPLPVVPQIALPIKRYRKRRYSYFEF